MRFDVNRLSVLAGLPASKSQRLSEASNRSLHDEKAQSIEGEADHRFGKDQLAEERDDKKGDEHKDDGKEEDEPRGSKPGDKDYVNETVYIFTLIPLMLTRLIGHSVYVGNRELLNSFLVLDNSSDDIVV